MPSLTVSGIGDRVEQFVETRGVVIDIREINLIGVRQCSIGGAETGYHARRDLQPGPASASPVALAEHYGLTGRHRGGNLQTRTGVDLERAGA